MWDNKGLLQQDLLNIDISAAYRHVHTCRYEQELWTRSEADEDVT